MANRPLLGGAVLLMSSAGACGAPATASRAPTTTADAPASLRSIAVTDLCVASGRLTTLDPVRSRVEAEEVRAATGGRGAKTAEIAFTYLGPTASVTPLANGELRRQIGLKLRARDTCNVVYVMWRIEPTSGIFVSVKHNPGKSTHAACGANGYLDLKPDRAPSLPAVHDGEAHVLRAVTTGNEIRVFVDHALAWEGSLPSAAFDFDGPTGIRSDNARFDFELRDDASEHAHCSAR